MDFFVHQNLLLINAHFENSIYIYNSLYLQIRVYFILGYISN